MPGHEPLAYTEQRFDQLKGLDGISDGRIADVWEHAFMRDYRATERDRYIDAFLRNVDWQAVDRRLSEPAAMRFTAAN